MFLIEDVCFNCNLRSEAHPEKFNSRIRNKMFYGQMGGKDLLQRKWKDLTEFVSLECDGKDYTTKIREHKFHALLFLNIPRLVAVRWHTLTLICVFFFS
jgi:hypothetical protein